jgi:ribosomal protein L15
MVGSSDIKVYINGKIIAVEVKMKDKQSEAQKQYQSRIEQAGGQYWIVRNFEEFYNKYINLI